MKVAVLGATGKEGQLLLAEAKRRGMDVTAIVRNASKITDGTPTIEKDVYQLTKNALVCRWGRWNLVCGPRTHNSIKRYTIIPSRNSAISFGDGRSFKLIERSSKHPLDLY